MVLVRVEGGGKPCTNSGCCGCRCSFFLCVFSFFVVAAAVVVAVGSQEYSGLKLVWGPVWWG